MEATGYNIIGLTGGEPALHGDYKKIIELIVNKNMQYTFVTNGYNIEPYLEMVDAYPGSCNALAVSLDGPTAEVHNRLRKKGFEEAISAIKEFTSRELFVNVNMLVTEDNRDHVVELIKLSASLGASAVWLAGAIPNQGKLKSMDWHGGRREVKISAKRASNDYGIPVNYACCFLRMGDVMKCVNMRKPQLALNPEGEIVFCCNTFGRGAILGNYSHKSLLEYMADAEKLGIKLMNEKMRLYNKGMMDVYSSNCEFCNNYLETIIKQFKVKTTS